MVRFASYKTSFVLSYGFSGSRIVFDYNFQTASTNFDVPSNQVRFNVWKFKNASGRWAYLLLILFVSYFSWKVKG